MSITPEEIERFHKLAKEGINLQNPIGKSKLLITVRSFKEIPHKITDGVDYGPVPFELDNNGNYVYEKKYEEHDGYQVHMMTQQGINLSPQYHKQYPLTPEQMFVNVDDDNKWVTMMREHQSAMFQKNLPADIITKHTDDKGYLFDLRVGRRGTQARIAQENFKDGVSKIRVIPGQWFEIDMKEFLLYKKIVELVKP